MRQEFDQVKERVQVGTGRSNPSSSWREIDDLLRVPTIPSQVRKQLVEKAMARSLEDALQPRPRATQAADAKSEVRRRRRQASEVKPADGKSDVKPADGKS